MEQFVQRANIEHFETLLDRTTDATERGLILKLLAEEFAKKPLSDGLAKQAAIQH